MICYIHLCYSVALQSHSREMFYTPLSLAFACAFGLASLVNATFYYPNPQASLLEHILVDTHGEYSSGFANAITPCSNYVSGAQTFGRETAAQWLRVAFHDFVTAHVAEGTGGIDASIGFETLRDENSGSAFNDSFGFFRPYVNSKVSSELLLERLFSGVWDGEQSCFPLISHA